MLPGSYVFCIIDVERERERVDDDDIYRDVLLCLL